MVPYRALKAQVSAQFLKNRIAGIAAYCFLPKKSMLLSGRRIDNILIFC